MLVHVVGRMRRRMAWRGADNARYLDTLSDSRDICPPAFAYYPPLSPLQPFIVHHSLVLAATSLTRQPKLVANYCRARAIYQLYVHTDTLMLNGY